MKASIIKIGNSKGIRIPKALLEQIGLDKDVELKVKDGAIMISPAKTSKQPYNDEFLMSLSALSDWNDPQEDEAWASLQ
ncbi:AbrB/MazE/SpoVT family DNA-binding domain-containing protein [Candidatus Saccharibacteria bacterium]|nr:AbrB/MazE/SpoVT family DNA-binding domain-containing protein [Candidatus Saccharibacteria bacterium]